MAFSTKNRFLRYEEELALSLFFCNVEKFNWLLGADCFSASILTEPTKIGYKELAPYIITAGYKKLFNSPKYDDLRKRNDQIAEILETRYNISLDFEICLDWGKDRPLYGFVPNKSKNDFTNESSYYLVSAISQLDIPTARMLLLDGANPLEVIKDENWTTYHEFMNHYYCTMDNYNPGEEDWDRMRTSIVNFFPNYVLREQMKELLHQYIPEDIQNSVMKDVHDKWDGIKSPFDSNDYVLDNSLKTFLDEIDQPGAVLAIIDEDKITNRFGGTEIMNVYEKVLEYVMTELKYLSIRVGGNSYRSGNFLATLMKEKNYPTGRFVNLICSNSESRATFTEPNVREIDMRDFDFKKDMELVEIADKFDIRCMHRNELTHSLVWFYVNNISTGWFKADGDFMPFNSNIKGLWMLTEVAKIRGFLDMKPASAVLYSDLFPDRSSVIASNVRELCKDLNIKSFNINFEI